MTMSCTISICSTRSASTSSPGRLLARRMASGEVCDGAWPARRTAGAGRAGRSARQERPTGDVLSLPPEKIPALLVSNFDVIKPYLPEGPDLDFMGDRYREGGTLARLLWEHPYDHKNVAVSASADHADAPGLGRGGRADPGRASRDWRASFPRPTSRYSKARVTSCSTRSAKPWMQCSDSSLEPTPFAPRV